MKQVHRVSAIASFVVDEQNQQNHIATRHYFKGLVTVNVTMELITVVKRTQICMVRNGPVNLEDEPVALFTNLNFKRVVGCQVFWPLKLWYFVWYVLKTKDNKSCRLR